jgi:hypothetical protein
MALFITLGLISRPSAKMLSLAQHPDYAQHLSVYDVNCTVHVAGKTTIFNRFLGNRPNAFCWASDYLIWSSFWSPE